MNLYIISLLAAIIALLLALPKGVFHDLRVWFTDVLDVNPVRVASKERTRSKGGLSSQIMRVSKHFYYYLPVQMRNVGKAKVTRLIRYAGIEHYGVEEMTGLRYLVVLLSLLYTMLLYLLSGDRLLIFFGLALSSFLFLVPVKYLEIKSQRRLNNIQNAIPSLLTSGAIMLDAGMNIQQMLECISDASSSDLSKCVRGALHKTKIGVSLSKALEETLESCSIEEYRSFISLMVQGLEHGASGLSEMVRRLALESWDARKRLAQNLAQKASMKLFLPLVFLVLPAMLIFLMGPMAFYIGGIFK